MDVVLFNSFLADIANGIHTLSSDTLKVALSNTAPSATNTILAEIIEITAGNGYTAGGATLGGVTSTQTSGVYKLESNSVAWSASGGAISEFRYAVLYNDTTSTDRLIAYWDCGSAQNVQSGNQFTITFTGRDVIIIQ